MLTFAFDDVDTAVARDCSSPSVSSWELPGTSSASEAMRHPFPSPN